MVLKDFLKVFQDKDTKDAATPEDYLKAMAKELQQTHAQYDKVKLSSLPKYEELKTKQDDFKIDLIHLLVNRLHTHYQRTTYDTKEYMLHEFYKSLLSQLLQSKIAFTEETLLRIARDFAKEVSYGPHVYQYPYHPLLTRIEEAVEKNGLTSSLQKTLQILYLRDKNGYTNREDDKVNSRIDALMAGQKKTRMLYRKDDTIGEAIDKAIIHSELAANKWQRLIEFLYEGKEKSSPTQKWLKQAEKEINNFDKAELRDFILLLCDAAIDLLKHIHKQNYARGFIHENNEQLLRGAVWLASLLNDKAINDLLDELGLLCYKKFPGVGALMVRIGNACIYTFAALPYHEGIAYLSKFRMKLKYPSAIRIVEKYIQLLSEKSGKTADELEDMAVPDYGLGVEHQLKETFGECAGQLVLTDSGKVEVKWFNPEGKEQKSVPASVKTHFPAELKAFSQKVKDIQSMLPVQSSRVEQFYLKTRTWKYADWKTNYLSHGLMSFLTKKLIWFFEKEGKKALGIYYQNQWLTAEEIPIEWIDDDTQVQLWHPIGFEPETVLAWRNLLVKWQIKQPFKQAYREVYIITDAELNTYSYSNRFAAHILRQHQFAALCKARGWYYTLQGSWDSHNIPFIHLPQWNIRAEYWVEANWQGSETHMGIFNYLFTDQVRFYNQERQLNVDEVPALVFSELMRDVDLFVGVTSIGNDPNWQDNGDARMNTYWHDYSLGDLSVSAQTRKAVLEKLVPRLKIANRCSFNGKFLLVKGHIRTYKIHLGSGNILMEPNDQYLCIVPDRKSGTAAENVFLPFEGDSVLSIILSKAFLLAEDTKITDPTITRQIKSH